MPETFAARLVSVAGGSVTAVEIHPVAPDPREVSSQTCAARIKVGVICSDAEPYAGHALPVIGPGGRICTDVIPF